VNARDVQKPLGITVHICPKKVFTVERNPMEKTLHIAVHFNTIKGFTMERNPMNVSNVEKPWPILTHFNIIKGFTGEKFYKCKQCGRAFHSLNYLQICE
jgi:hypothetical protein